MWWLLELPQQDRTLPRKIIKVSADKAVTNSSQSWVMLSLKKVEKLKHYNVFDSDKSKVCKSSNRS